MSFVFALFFPLCVCVAETGEAAVYFEVISHTAFVRPLQASDIHS